MDVTYADIHTFLMLTERQELW